MQVSSLLDKLATGTAWISQASRFAYFDPMDTNRDGKVSATEVQAHVLNHPRADTLPRQDSWEQSHANEVPTSTSKVSAFSFRDARDANGNGAVSAQEGIAYTLKHPAPATNSPLSQAVSKNTSASMGAAAGHYSSTGALTSRWGTGASSFDRFV